MRLLTFRCGIAGGTVGVFLAVAGLGVAHADEHDGGSGQVTVDPVHLWSRTEPPKVRMDAEYDLRSSSASGTAGSDRSGPAAESSSSSSGPSGPVCTFEPITNVGGVKGDKVVDVLDTLYPDMYIGSRGGDESQAFSMRCAGVGGGWVIGDGTGGPGSGPGGAGAVALPSPAELAERARQTLVLPLPTPGMSPRAKLADGRSATLVNENTWIWTDPDDWTTQSERVQVGPVWAEVTAQPKQIRFDSGMGQRITCDGPGTPYERSYARAEPGLRPGVSPLDVWHVP